MSPRDSPSLSDTALAALTSNKAHQYALKVYSDKLQAELAAVDKLLEAADVDEEEMAVNAPGELRIEGASKISGLLNSTELTHESSPFYADAQRRQRYFQAITTHTMRPKELTILADAVRQENRRIFTLRAQQQGTQPPSADSPELDENVDGLDWDRISRTVTAASYVGRSAQECRVRWLGDRHPKFSHTAWTNEERDRAKELVHEAQSAGGIVDWVNIAERLGTNRTPIDVMRNAVDRKSHVWDQPSEQRLVEAVDIYGLENWSLVARYVSQDATPASCQGHWYRSFDPAIKTGRWTSEEDERLKRAVMVYGKSWVDVATVMGGRTSDQCRDRYTEHLGTKAPKKGRWGDEEDSQLREAVSELGTESWMDISERVSGRSDAQCRARWGIISSEQSKPSKPPKSANSTAARKRKRKDASELAGEVAPGHSLAGADEAVNTGEESTVEPTQPRPKPRPVKKRKQINEGEASQVREPGEETMTTTPTKKAKPPKKISTPAVRKQPSRRSKAAGADQGDGGS